MTDKDKIELAESTVAVRLLGIKLAEAMTKDEHKRARGLADEIAQHLAIVRNGLTKEQT